MLREMSQPLIPFDFYDDFGDLGKYDDAERLVKIRELVDDLQPQNLNTLKFTIKFFIDLVKQEKVNKMTAYNCAVTVGPNIFRSSDNAGADILSAGIYYDTMIRMIEYYDVIFEGKEYVPEDDKGGVGVLGGQTSRILNVKSQESEVSDSESIDMLAQMAQADEED